MRKRTLVLGFLLAIFLVFSLAVTVGASSAGVNFKVNAYQGEESSSPDAVRVKVYNGVYSMILPSCANRGALRVWYSGENLRFNGVEVPSGTTTDVFLADRVEVTRGKNAYELLVLQYESAGAVFITTECGNLVPVFKDKEHKEPGEIVVVDEKGEAQYSGALEYIKGRGNSTWNNPKKPFNIKLDKKADLFGMGKAKKWCLLADFTDHAFMRNDLGYFLSRALGNEATSDTRLVSFYSNGDYMGAYTLTEKVEIGENRVDITDLQKATEKVNDEELDAYALAGRQNSAQRGTYKYSEIPNDPEDITGGYLLELEKYYRYAEEVAGFVSPKGQCVTIKEPECVTKKQASYIYYFYKEFEEALTSPNGFNSLGKYYTDYIDADELAAAYLLQEFCANFDGNSSSFYLYKEAGENKLHIGPAWDLDLSFGNSFVNEIITFSLDPNDPETPYIFGTYLDNRFVDRNSFLGLALNHADFVSAVRKLWQEKGEALVKALLDRLDAASEENRVAAVMNFLYWDTFGTTDVDALKAHFDAAVESLRAFITARAAFLDRYLSDGGAVRYETGTRTEKLTLDMNIYGREDEAEVLAPANGKTENDVFLGWALTPGAETPDLQPGDRVKVGAGKILYAVWKDAPALFLPGDVDLDREVTAADARLALRRAVELETFRKGSAQFAAADADRDGEITAADARLILRVAVELEDLTAPAQPADPPTPEEPEPPTDPVPPEEPGDGEDPEPPADPEPPTDPEPPEEPGDGEDPTQPENPGDGEDPVRPDLPDLPLDPVEPDPGIDLPPDPDKPVTE